MALRRCVAGTRGAVWETRGKGSPRPPESKFFCFGRPVCERDVVSCQSNRAGFCAYLVRKLRGPGIIKSETQKVEPVGTKG